MQALLDSRLCQTFLALPLLIFLLAAKEATFGEDLKNAAGLPVEGDLAAFLGDPLLERTTVFEDKDRVREPYLAVALDGTVLAMRNYDKLLSRSKDGGRSWSEPAEVPFGFLDSNFIVDENSGDILVLVLSEGRNRVWRSRDHGASWAEEEVELKPNEVMKWMERTGFKTRGAHQQKDDDRFYILHANASEGGLTLRHGPRRGRLIVSATFRPLAKEHPSDRKPVDGIHSCAVYSDDGGKSWRVSGLFPEATTEEAAIAELSDGRLYFNSRSCSGFYDKARARELRPEEIYRRESWSEDAGETWENLRVSPVLIDGGGYDRGYGLKGGLARLPVKGRDILVYSNADTAGGARERLTVWASFDGGQTWPVKRLLNEGHSAYSSLDTGRPGTADEGVIYLLFEGGPEGAYTAMQLARLNLAWILGGEATGDGEVPDWVR
jgi:sialidase-1